jgi:hypothetical protein
MRTAGVALILIPLLLACESQGEVTRRIPLKNLKPDEAFVLALPYLGDSTAISIPGPATDADDVLPVLTVSGPRDRVEQVEAVVRERDRPKPDVLLRFQIIEADGYDTSDPAIEDVTRVLRDLFRFEGYRLAAEAVVRSSAYGEISQVVHGSDGTRYSINGEVRDITIDDAGRSAASLELTLWVTQSIPALDTSVNVPSGQLVVLGTTRPRADGPTLILVVQPEVIQE